jgi:hypothetical protein
MATFEQVLKVADDAAPAGTAILVVGSMLDGHQQLWAPARVDRVFFYDEWMWYWHTRHQGPYDPLHASKFDPDRLDEIFERAYLDRNAIGAVVVSEDLQWMADDAPTLRRVFGGTFGVYMVGNPVPIVTLAGGAPRTLRVANDRIDASGESPGDAGGEAIVRRNWFPRWRARVNGRPAPIVEDDNGYMRVAIPSGAVDLTLTYELERADLAARVAGIAGIGIVAVWWIRPRRSSQARG